MRDGTACWTSAGNGIPTAILERTHSELVCYRDIVAQMFWCAPEPDENRAMSTGEAVDLFQSNSVSRRPAASNLLRCR